jgi:cobalt/nickel transport system permease protein
MNAAKQHTQCRNFPQDYQWISKQLDTQKIFSYVNSATIFKFFTLFTGVKSMHMADALLSPTVGGTMLAATAVTTLYCARKVQRQLDNSKIPLMGVLGAFVFAAQMINFAIPATGSSGHIGGGLLLAILLGPHAAFLTLSSVLTVQALFFADGGLLALGCNIFNLGFFPCFIAYPFIYKKIVRDKPDSRRLAIGSILAAIIGLQLGSLGVVLQTHLSGIAALPLFSFLVIMQPIHLAIGLVEGLATAGVVSFIWKARPEILDRAMNEQPLGKVPVRNIIIALVAATALTGGILAWYASEHPDGLEWAIEKVTGNSEIVSPSHDIHNKLERIQQKTSFLPDYSFKENEVPFLNERDPFGTYTGTTLSGLIGGLLVLAFSVLAGFVLKKRSQPV